ncbi:MAG: hypothetical protein HC934_02955 [Acaryochloridaceae cyanobacterium SU_2_1]|nr:hypothetical protein [Acaryochloridaceae cyanobacterium SU_2_1]
MIDALEQELAELEEELQGDEELYKSMLEEEKKGGNRGKNALALNALDEDISATQQRINAIKKKLSVDTV